MKLSRSGYATAQMKPALSVQYVTYAVRNAARKNVTKGVRTRPKNVAVRKGETMNQKREEEKQYFFTAVNFCLNMWNDSGDIDYLHKAIANIRAVIDKEESKAK